MVKDSGVSSAGAGCFTFRVRRLWDCWNWGHWDDDVHDGSVVSACRGFLSVLGPLQTVQRAELWGVILSLQAGDGIHLAVDNLGVVRHVGRILDGRPLSHPFELFWISVAITPISCRDIEVWPFSVGMLVKWVSFLSSLHWPADECDLGVGGVSCVELLILYELWAGERLQLEKTVPTYRRPGRSISVSAVPCGPGTDIWRSCRFLGALFRCLRDLPFGLRRFLPGPVSLRLRIFGTSFWSYLVILIGLHLPLRYCSARFAWKLPTWRLPDGGRIRELVT